MQAINSSKYSREKKNQQAYWIDHDVCYTFFTICTEETELKHGSACKTFQAKPICHWWISCQNNLNFPVGDPVQNLYARSENIASFANSRTWQIAWHPIDDQAGVLWGRSDKEVLYRTQNLECQSNRIFIYSYLQYIISGQFMVVWRWGSSKFDLRVVEQSSICHLSTNKQ